MSLQVEHACSHLFPRICGAARLPAFHSLTPAASESNSVVISQQSTSYLCYLPFRCMSLFPPCHLSILIALQWVVFSTMELLIKIDFGKCYRFYGNNRPYYALYPTQAVPCVCLHIVEPWEKYNCWNYFFLNWSPRGQWMLSSCIVAKAFVLSWIIFHLSKHIFSAPKPWLLCSFSLFCNKTGCWVRNRNGA